jgi:hypothetical protein
MAFLFRNKPKSNAELTKSTKELLIRLIEEPKPNPKVRTISSTTSRPTNALGADRRRAGQESPANEDMFAGHARYFSQSLSNVRCSAMSHKD